MIVHPGAIHAYDAAADMGIVNLLFDSSRLSLPLLDGYALPLFKKIFPDTGDCRGFAEPVTHLDEDGLHELLQMLEKIRDELNNIHPGRQLRSLAVFLEILVFLARKSGTDGGGQQMKFLIGDAVRYMNNHYAEPVKVEQLAKKAKMSLRSFTRHFPEMVGCSPIEYLMKLRLHHASDLLINTDLTLSEIAEQCGFYDSNYFCKKFRQAFNASPRRFRMNFQSGKNVFSLREEVFDSFAGEKILENKNSGQRV